ncbi:hypothetical protein MA16_Dca019466 [Dendrobium catenatum]|uniref:CFA20 domain-containing protein n=1 Tax=Dendrobium catenatum TaxID=906689 RepID=A0A2I0WHF2_9ASPA|nr:hypothetical protein MA16_Dca019466 [Dendrobium catenatum]
MFKNTFQSGFLSILYSLGYAILCLDYIALKFVVVSSGGFFSNLLLLLGRSKPLQIWDKEVVNGQIKRPHDEDIQSSVLEIAGSNVQSTYITCPADPAATLGIKLPFLVMIVKNLKKYFTFEIQSMTRVKPFICTMPLRLEDGWNNIQLNLTDLTRRAYGTNYVETLRVQVHANCRLRRIYFSDRLYSEEELPPEFKLYLPMQKIWLKKRQQSSRRYFQLLFKVVVEAAATVAGRVWECRQSLRSIVLAAGGVCKSASAGNREFVSAGNDNNGRSG